MRSNRILTGVVVGVVGTGVVLAGEFELVRQSTDGGGVMRSTGGGFELSGTIGQPDAVVLTGGVFELSGGFWFGLPPGDCEDDGDVDLYDHEMFAACSSGPDGLFAVDCACFDVDRSGAVDLADFRVIQLGFTGRGSEGRD